ncbi:excinuclease ABC subunit UvrA [Kiritimatiella glycovorans]|uniref:UvrABC system protein A n=1 Tax=Kiritimatiella glycovorans TaxID=1307763 RepID=A0A0G3EN40_9BACT|nr:excinuclease ABC subunit UvrA [Kiritimatiella glycovorans]AKJ65569.1 Excinuclease ABC subunit A [Kiritimatiella glycovorans]
MPPQDIAVHGAREHNLKNITVRLPRNKLTVVTGLSGSGKSSLAFDTVYAEGQRKYVESLSAYARQFLEQMQKPAVERIDGLSPAISIEQRTAGGNPRSIVATTTEIHDYLRLLFAHIGTQHCWQCGRAVTRQTAEDIVEQLLALEDGTRAVLLAPLVQGRKGGHEEVFSEIRRQGYVRVRLDGEIVELDEVPRLDKRRKHSIETVVDRLVIREGIRGRLADSVETALALGEGQMTARIGGKQREQEERLFSEKNACLHCGLSFPPVAARNFSFNSPYGACPTCHGLGTMLTFDEDLVVPDKSVPLEKAIHPWRRGGRRMIIYYKRLLRCLADHYGIDLDTPYEDLPERFHAILLHGSGDEEIEFAMWRRGRNHRYAKPFEGVLPNLRRRYEETESDYQRQRLRGYMTRQHCTDCDGARLRPESLAVRVGGSNIREVLALPVRDAGAFFEGLELSGHEARIAGEILKEIRERLRFLIDVGLDYLTLDRESGTLSGGEAQRIRLATQIGSRLAGVLYVLDEPSIGLHQRDNLRLIETLRELRDVGNTVVVVEHDEQTILSADHLIDLGPGAGEHGGEVMYQGNPEGLREVAASATAQYLNREREIGVPEFRHEPERGYVTVRGASENNLKDVDVDIPVGLFTCVTGVSGSGKSTLVDDILRRALNRHFHGSRERPGAHRGIEGLEAIDKLIVIDQSPIGRTPRSNPVTYTGAFTFIRGLFAKLPASQMRGYGPGRFSFNVKGGRCERCRGDGMLKIEMHFLPDIYVPCEQCAGRRYNKETLDVRYKGRNINDVLEMTVEEALDFFSAVPSLARKLRTLSEVGLGYIRLGQPATTLSGGEAQRIKLATELSKRSTGRTLYLLDEPTTGLHFADVHKLLEVLERLRDEGNSVLVIEHHLDVIKRADYIVDLGPEGGEGGGQVVAAGPPEEVAGSADSYTGRYLREVLRRT